MPACVSESYGAVSMSAKTQLATFDISGRERSFDQL